MKPDDLAQLCRFLRYVFQRAVEDAFVHVFEQDE